MDASILPPINATLNGIATLLLTLGFVFIKSGNKKAHKTCMISAFATSAVFLLFYVLHKILVKGVHTPFGGEGFIRTVYYTMLFSHIVLAIAIVPMVLMTMSRAFKENFTAHKAIARWTWPVWMYVSVTGVLVYFFLYVWFPKK
jgi:putative membrane protein